MLNIDGIVVVSTCVGKPVSKFPTIMSTRELRTKEPSVVCSYAGGLLIVIEHPCTYQHHAHIHDSEMQNGHILPALFVA
eukprot:563472-Amphidinium_carterae.1